MFDQTIQELVSKIADVARSFGLDFYETRFEVVDYDTMNELAAYGGFPGRYPHWRFGMEYERLKKSYSYGLHKIYEMVINNDPAYAYLLEDNSIVDQKIVIAHVFAHVDFFKNNAWFSHTNRKMVDEMANHGARIRRYIEEYGLEKVENFIDKCLSLENLIDAYAPYVVRQKPKEKETPDSIERRSELEKPRFKTKKYLEPFVNPDELIAKEEEKIRREQELRAKRFPQEPERDILGFLIEHGKLERWQRNVLSFIREEAYYFAPQRMTKILNEGWAAYWHSVMLTTKLLSDDEIIDFADHHSATVAPSSQRLNPYALGLALLRDIKNRWDRGCFGKEWEECEDMEERERWDRKLMLGTKKLFEVRRIYNDVMFIDEFLTPEFAARSKLFRWKRDEGGIIRIDTRRFDMIKKQLLFQLTNMGEPVIYIEDANYGNRGELFLVHRYDGVELRRDWAIETLKNLVFMWGRPVHLQTVFDQDKKVLISHDGSGFQEKSL